LQILALSEYPIPPGEPRKAEALAQSCTLD